jgi:predicted phage terminase large subunit-like protein
LQTRASDEAEYLALLEAEHRAQIRGSLDKFCRDIEIPGAPLVEDSCPDGDDCEVKDCPLHEVSTLFYPDKVLPAEHHDLLNGKLQKVADGEIKRLMVFMPPGSAKSTYAGVTFPPWYLGNNPNKCIIATSYGSVLARKFGRRVRAICEQPRFQQLFGATTRKDNRAVDDWALTNSATYMAGGILSGITGNRADGLIIDDPIKGHEQADSPTIREKTWDAYLTDLRTRLKPNGFIIIIQTRWHESDLSGRILPKNYDGESGTVMSRDGEPWEVVCLQAQAERFDDPLGRKIGGWLWTSWFSVEHWVRERAIQGERNWSALYQQRPKPADGALIKRAWPRRYDAKPAEFLRIVQSWDTAYKDNEINDPQVCTTWGETRGGWYLLHVYRDRVDYPSLKRMVSSLAQQWEPDAILIEDKSSGQSLIQEMRAGFAVPVIAIDTEGQSKTDRLIATSSLWESGMVWLPESAPWLPDYESEIFGFPMVTHDDQTDSSSQALNWMWKNSGRYEAYSTGEGRAGMQATDDTSDITDRGYGSIGSGDQFGGFL